MVRKNYHGKVREALKNGELEREKLFLMVSPTVPPSDGYRAAEIQRVYHKKKMLKKGKQVLEWDRKYGEFEDIVKQGQRLRIKQAVNRMARENLLIHEVRDGKRYYRLPDSNNGSDKQ